MVKAQPIITPEDLEKIYNAPMKSHPSQRFKINTLIQLLSESGARISEITNLKVSDLDLKEKLLTFRDTKNGQDRKIPITNEMASKLKRLVKDRQNDDTVFGMGRIAAHQALKRRLERAGIKKRIHPHTFRHNFITNKLRKHPLPAVQKFVGHKSLQSTAVYTHFDMDDLRGVLDA